jgi:hypothetical protein
MAGNAILVQDGTDIPAEFHSIVGVPMEERADWPNQKRGYRKDREGSGFRPGKAKRGRLGHGLTNQFNGKLAIAPVIWWDVASLLQVGEPYRPLGNAPGFIGHTDAHVDWDESWSGCSLSGAFPSSFPVEMCEESELSELSLPPARMSAGEFGHAAL